MNASRDENRESTLLGVDHVSFSTPTTVAVNSTTHEMLTESTVSSSALPTGASTSAKQDTLLTELQLKADLTETQPVSLATVPSHPVTNAGTFAVQVDPISTIYHGTKTVPTGTAETIASSQAIKSVTVKSLSTNFVAIYVGATGVTTSGFELLPGESVSLDVNNLNLVYCISGSASQIIRYIAI